MQFWSLGNCSTSDYYIALHCALKAYLLVLDERANKQGRIRAGWPTFETCIREGRQTRSMRSLDAVADNCAVYAALGLCAGLLLKRAA